MSDKPVKQQEDVTPTHPVEAKTDDTNNTGALSRRDFLKFTGIAGASALASKYGVPALIQPARKVLRLQTSYPVDYPNTLVLVNNVFAEFRDSHPDFEVEMSFVRARDVARTFVQTSQVNRAPDFFYAFESQGTLAYGNHLYDLTGLVNELGLYDDFYQPALDLWTIDGKLVGIPTYYGVKCYVYRTDIWEEAGLDPDHFPSTWEEFQDAAIKLTKHDAAGAFIRDGFDHARDFEHLVMHIHQNGGAEYASDDAVSASTINSPEALEAFRWWCDLIRVHGVQSREARAVPEGADTILDGFAGVDLQGPWWVPEARAAKPELFEQGLIRVGAPLTRAAQVGHLDASGWGVNANSDILEETLDFVKIFLKNEHYAHYFDAISEDGNIVYRYPTSRRSINESPDFWIANEPMIKDTAFSAAFDMGRSTARKHLGYNEVVSYVYSRMIERGLFQIKDDQGILDDAAGQIDGITERSVNELK